MTTTTERDMVATARELRPQIESYSDEAESLRRLPDGLVGLFRDPGEIQFVLGKLQPLFEREFHQHGFVHLGMGGGFGQTIFLGRQPARTLADLRHGRYWIWDLDEVPRVLDVPLEQLDAARGGIPDDIAEIILSHPDLIEELRRQYGSR